MESQLLTEISLPSVSIVNLASISVLQVSSNKMKFSFLEAQIFVHCDTYVVSVVSKYSIKKKRTATG